MLLYIFQGDSVKELRKNAGLVLGRSDLGWLGIDGVSLGDFVFHKQNEGYPPTVDSLIQNIGAHDLVTTIRDGKVAYLTQRYTQ